MSNFRTSGLSEAERKAVQRGWDELQYNMSDGTFMGNFETVKIAVGRPKDIPWSLLDYVVKREKISNFKTKAFIICLQSKRVFASYCTKCYTKSNFNKHPKIYLEAGQFTTMISFICKHHTEWNMFQPSITNLRSHCSSTCWNKSSLIWNNLAAALSDPSYKNCINFQHWPSCYKLCKNCQLSAAVMIRGSLMHTTHRAAQYNNIASIICIHEICKMLAFTLQRASTAKYIIQYALADILSFIYYAIQGLCAYFQFAIHKKDQCSTLLLHCLLDVFSEMILILCQHCMKFTKLKYPSNRVRDNNCLYTGVKTQFINVTKHFINNLLVYNYVYTKKINYINIAMLNDKSILEIKIISPLIVLTLLFEPDWYPQHEQWKIETVHYPSIQRMLYHSLDPLVKNKKRWIKQLISIPKYGKYLEIRNQKIRFKSVECQWQRCNNTKCRKKCRNCKVARYCSRRCQKLDWNKGFHREICGRLVDPSSAFGQCHVCNEH